MKVSAILPAGVFLFVLVVSVHAQFGFPECDTTCTDFCEFYTGPSCNGFIQPNIFVDCDMMNYTCRGQCENHVCPCVNDCASHCEDGMNVCNQAGIFALSARCSAVELLCRGACALKCTGTFLSQFDRQSVFRLQQIDPPLTR